MYRIDRVQFEDREEAEGWAHGNVGGCYSITPLAFCHTCGDWQDDGEFYHGNKILALAGWRYYQMPTTHQLWDLRCWVFGFPIRG